MRPILPDHIRKEHVLLTRVTRAEAARLKAAAATQGITVAALIREAALTAADDAA